MAKRSKGSGQQPIRDSTEAAAADRKARRLRAERILERDPVGVLEAALHGAVVHRLAELGAPAAMVGALVQAGTAPAAWRRLPVWTRGPHGLQAMIPRVRVDGLDMSLLVRAGDPEWTGAQHAASGAGVDVDVTAGEILGEPSGGRTLAAVVGEWLGSTAVSGRLPALTVVVEAARLPEPVDAEIRRDRRILPRITVSDPAPERQAGLLFGGLGQRIERTPQLTLPLWAAPAVKRVPILELVDESGVPFMARGKGVPLPARLFVRALVSVRPADRGRESVRIALKLRELRDGLFPGGGWWTPKDWPRLRHALQHARDYGIPHRDGLWFALALRHMPDTFTPEGEVVLDVAFPPGSQSGAPVELPALDALATTRAPRWRAYIAALSLAWAPGTTRVKHPESGRWGWTRRLDAYPVLTAHDRRLLAFGAADRKHRTTREVDKAFRELPGLVGMEHQTDPRTGEIGWRMVPVEARATGESSSRTGDLENPSTGESEPSTGESEPSTGEK